MGDREFYEELERRKKAGTLRLLAVDDITVEAGSFKFVSSSGFTDNVEISMCGRPLLNVTKVVVIAEGLDPGILVALEIEPMSAAFDKSQWCATCRKAGGGKGCNKNTA